MTQVSTQDNRLQLSGPVVMQNLASLYQASLAKVAAGDTVIDMAGVTEADSSAVSLLLDLRREGLRHAHKVSVVNLPDSVKSLAKLYGVGELLPAQA
jgi:phospholipid transport system transporter-binding protein